MTESNPSTATTAVAPPRPAPPADAAADPLASLHKMSTTAGVTSQEYVAINIPSIVALVLGLASVVAVLNPVLLVIPLAAVVTAVAALKQIRESNGTQTGRGFAWLGIVLSLAIGGFVFARAVARHFQSQADRREIISKMEDLGRLVHERKYEQAYGLFSTRFQSRINRQTFDANWDAQQNFPELGPVVAIEWNRTGIEFKDDPNSGARVGYGGAWVRFQKGGEPARYVFEFRKSGQKWEIHDLPAVFPADRPARRRRQ